MTVKCWVEKVMKMFCWYHRNTFFTPDTNGLVWDLEASRLLFKMFLFYRSLELEILKELVGRFLK